MSFKVYIAYLLILLGCSSYKEKNVIVKLSPQQNSKQLSCESISKPIKYLLKFQKDEIKVRYLKGKNCANQEILKQIENHNGTIGILYSTDKELNAKNKLILEGINQGIEKNRFKLFKIKRGQLTGKIIDKAVSDFLFKDKVGLVISWGNQKLAKRLNFWQKNISLPIMFIGGQLKAEENLFKIYPNDDNYIAKLINPIRKKQIKKIAILTPAHYEKSEILKSIKNKIKEHEIEIVHDVIYDSENYESMDLACRKLFTIDRHKRWEEYRSILLNEKRKAKEKGFNLNPKLVFLPAKVDYDAIFIPDNFKIVTYFTKLFEYYQMPKTLLIGTHEWRSKDLLKANSKLLEGSIFVDFIGNLNQLPEKLKEEEKDLLEGPGVGTDYKLMGFYAVKLALMASEKSRNRRNFVSMVLKKVRIKDNIFNNELAFVNNELNWPSYLFQVVGDNVVLHSNKKAEKDISRILSKNHHSSRP